jgi:hypothetical protein
LENGQYRLEVPARANNPKKLEQIRQPGLAGSSVTVECQRYSPLGANISWFRSGFLVLAAKCGYSLIRDKAFDVVRRQIIEDDTSLMPVWLSIAPAGFPEVQRGLWTVLSPDWHKGYVVQFNQRLIHFPKPGDLSFYERLGDPLRHREPTTCRFECVVDDATFGLSGDVP